MATLSYNFTTSYIRRSTTKKNGNTPILLRLYYNGRERFIPIGFEILPTQWNHEKGKVVKHKQSIHINTYLSQIEQKVQQYQLRSMTEGTPIVLDQVRNYVFNDQDPQDAHSFFKEQLKQYRGESSTIKKHKLALDYLAVFSPDLVFSQINYDFLTRFQSWLLQQPNRVRKGSTLSASYVGSIFSSLQYYITEALKRDLLDKDPFKGFKRGHEEKTPVHITLAEVDRLIAMPTDETKDVFTFACCTGLRFKDLFYLRVGDIKKTSEGLVMVVVPKKTEKRNITVQINLSEEFEGRPERIVKPYLENKEPGDRVFGPRNPETYNSDYNKALKKLQKAAGIDLVVDGKPKGLTTHVARHTCAMIMLNEFGKRLVDIKAYLGHTNINTTQIYARVTYRTIDEI